MKDRFRRGFGAAALISVLVCAPSRAQRTPAEGSPAQVASPNPTAVFDLQADANRTREKLNELLERQAPALRRILALDPSLASNQSFMAPYPAVAAFLAAHPDIARNPAFYFGTGNEYRHEPRQPGERAMEMWGDVLGGMAAFLGLGIAIGLLTWLVRTFIDYRRWSRLSKVQTEVHTKLMDRFGSSDELVAYMQTPAGARFLESSPIKLDPGPRSLGAPLGRILWSIQGGVVLACAGLGLWYVSTYVDAEAKQPIQSFGVLALSLGFGFVVSAILSYLVARRLGLIDVTRPGAPSDPSGV